MNIRALPLPQRLLAGVWCVVVLAVIALGVRTFAMEQLLAAWFLRPRGLVFGPPASVKAALATLAADPDPDMARMAAIAAGSAARLNLFGLPGLMRETR